MNMELLINPGIQIRSASGHRSGVHGALHAHGWLGEPLVPLTTERIQDLLGLGRS